MSSEMSSEIPHCLVCYADLTFPCIAPCDHNDVCATCHLRLRHLHSDKKCPMCKQDNQQLIVDRYEDAKKFDQYPLWGNELGSEFTFRDDVGMFFPTTYYDSEILPLFGYHCRACDYDGTIPDPNIYEEADQNNPYKNKKQSKGTQTPLRALQDHLRNKHRLSLCQLCVDFKRDFIARLPRFTPTQLKIHLTNGDGPDSGFKGHPICEFCRPKRFYDLTQLHMHLQKEHYRCHVCDKQGLANQYFRDYQALEKHFDRQHFLCKDVQCLSARFVVFENEIDLRAHELSIHGGTSTGSTKIQLQFRVRREGYSGDGYENQTVPSEEDFQYGLDGQAFVPEALPQQEGPDAETSDPLHFERTAQIRAQAAQIREAQNAQSQEEAFPSLSQVTSGTEGIRMGWTSGTTLKHITRKPGIGSNSVEDFPSLPTSSTNKRNNSVSQKLRSGGVSGSRQFAAMRNAAMGSAPTQSNSMWGARTDPPVAPAAPSTNPFLVTGSSGPRMNRESDLASDNFPALGGASSARASYPVNSYGAKAGVANISYPALGQPQLAPSINSSKDFPAPPSSTPKHNSVREKMLGDHKKAPEMSYTSFPLPQSQQSLQKGVATVEEMKASLGPTKYKQLKNLTKEFATDSLAPVAFVDHAASLFDGGYGDSEFWNFVPALLLSCPNQTSAANALRYMEGLRASATSHKSQSSTTSWASSPVVQADPISTVPASNFPSFNPTAIRNSSTQATIQPVVQNRSSNIPTTAPGKKKSAWGGTGATSVQKVKAAPGTVAIAAANEQPQSGTATKFMAKLTKEQNQANSSVVSGSKGKKKKGNDELRALAFGK